MKRFGQLAWEFLSVSALSLALGTGIGFLQGEFSTGPALGDIRMALPNEGAMTGAMFSLPVGWISYYLILGRKLSFEEFSNIIGVVALVAVLVGLAVGYLSKGEAAFMSSLFMIPIVLIVVTMLRKSHG